VEQVAAAHPTPQQLEAFVHGKLAVDEQQTVETHVASCDTCCTALRDIPHDELVAKMRAARPTSEPAATQFLSASQLRTVESVAETPPPLVDHPRYEIVRQVGAGGMGVVYEAKHRLMGRTVALKVISGQLFKNDAAVKRFRQEVEAAARLSHRNIVTAYDAEQAGDLHFLVMEFVAGTDLAALVRDRGRLPVLHACNYAMQAAQGLQHAYEQGMVHRDIKPQNLMRTPKGAIKILDFGLARLASPQGAEVDPSGLTSEGIALGTPDFMAPEQARDSRRADTRSDIYSLGCTLYYLLTGSVPFPEGTSLEKVMAHCQRPPTPLAQLRDDIPDEVLRIVERMMAKNPAERFQTPREVAEALKPHGKPTAAHAGPLSSDPMPVESRTLADGLQGPLDLLPPLDPLGPLDPFDVVESPAGSPLVLVTKSPWSSPRQAFDWRQWIGRYRRPLAWGLVVLIALSAAPFAIPLLQTKVAIQEDERWVDMLPLIDPARDFVSGTWRERGGELQVDATESARLALPHAVPSEYDFEVQFTRQSGAHSIALIFALGNHQASFEIDAWEDHLAGIQRIGEQDLRGAPSGVSRHTLENGRRYTALVKVRADHVEAYLDDQLIDTYRGDGTNLNLLELWRLPNSNQLGIGAYNSATTFHRIRIRPAGTLNGAASH